MERKHADFHIRDLIFTVTSADLTDEGYVIKDKLHQRFEALLRRAAISFRS